MGRRLRATLLSSIAALALVGLAAGGPSRTYGDVVTKDKAGDVRAAGLTKAELAALDIVSVRTVGAEGLGVIVTVTFRGDFQNAVGKGHLRNAAAALILKPKAAPATSAGLVNQGTGRLGTLFRHTRSTDVGVYRKGKTLKLFVLGPGFGSVGSVNIETLVDVGKLTAARVLAGDSPPYIGPRTWDRFITLHPIDLHVQVGDPSGLSCPELAKLLASIDADLDDPYFSQNVSFAVVRALHKFRGAVKGLLDKCKAPTPPASGGAFEWSRFSPREVAGSGRFTGPAQTFTGIRVVLPSTFTIVNQLCPSQLPIAAVSVNTIDCTGGTLQTGQTFTLNLATSPSPPVGMGGQLFGMANGTFTPPITITGP